MSEYRGKECALPTNDLWDRDYLRSVASSWETDVWLSYELEKIDSRLNQRQWSILINAIHGNLPVVIQYRDGEINGNMYVATHTMMVPYMNIHKNTNPNRLRVHHWGFGHDLYIDRIISITTPDSDLVKEDELVVRTIDY